MLKSWGWVGWWPMRFSRQPRVQNPHFPFWIWGLDFGLGLGLGLVNTPNRWRVNKLGGARGMLLNRFCLSSDWVHYGWRRRNKQRDADRHSQISQRAFHVLRPYPRWLLRISEIWLNMSLYCLGKSIDLTYLSKWCRLIYEGFLLFFCKLIF